MHLCDFFGSCSQSENNENKSEDNSIPEIIEEKPVYLWLDAEANFKRFSYQDSICYYLDKIKDTGFNHIVVDVRPIYGDVLYKKTSFMTQLTSVGNFSRTLEWDYLQFLLTKQKKEFKSNCFNNNFSGRKSCHKRRDGLS